MNAVDKLGGGFYCSHLDLDSIFAWVGECLFCSDLARLKERPGL